MTSNLDYRILILFVTIFLGIILLPLFMNRISKTEQHGGFFEKYYLADRKVSGIVLAITLMSTYGSASTFLGGPGVAYKLGYGWVLLAVIQVVTGYFVLLVLAKKFKTAAQKINAITISDYLKRIDVKAYKEYVLIDAALISGLSSYRYLKVKIDENFRLDINKVEYIFPDSSMQKIANSILKNNRKYLENSVD